MRHGSRATAGSENWCAPTASLDCNLQTKLSNIQGVGITRRHGPTTTTYATTLHFPTILQIHVTRPSPRHTTQTKPPTTTPTTTRARAHKYTHTCDHPPFPSALRRIYRLGSCLAPYSTTASSRSTCISEATIRSGPYAVQRSTPCSTCAPPPHLSPLGSRPRKSGFHHARGGGVAASDVGVGT